MSEFGLELPPTVKTGIDGKGPRGYIVKQSNAAVILGVGAVLVILSGCLFLDIQSQRTTFTSNFSMEHNVEEHQRLGKLEAETKLAEMSAKMNEQVHNGKDEESDLKIMASHISYVEGQARVNIVKAIDNEAFTVAEIKKSVEKEFTEMQTEIEKVLHAHLVIVEGANARSNAEMDRIEKEVQEEITNQAAYDEQLKAQGEQLPNHATDAGPTENKLIETRIESIFNHVYNLAEKMGDADIDALLDPSNVKDWEQVLTNAETGKLAYPDAIAKMEEIITKAPAALKLAEVTGALQLVEEDGGAKGVTEVTNFRNLLKEIHWLPQYAAVLQEFSAWKKGDRTVQQVLAWTEEKMGTGEIDGTWLTQAYEGKDVATATSTAKTVPRAAKPAAPIATKKATMRKPGSSKFASAHATGHGL